MKSLIIIPAYNEEACIEQTVRDILEHAPIFDYIVINDCSKDRTKEICEKNHFHYIDLPVNLGIGGAVQTGYKYACNHGYDYAVQVDGDGQHDPRFLEQMLQVMQEKKLDMLIGSRFITKEGFQSSGLRRTGIKYFTWLIRLLTGKTITDPTSGLRMINKDIIQYFAKEYPRDYPDPESIVETQEKSTGNSCHYACPRRWCFLYFSIKFHLLYGKSYHCDSDRTDSMINLSEVFTYA